MLMKHLFTFALLSLLPVAGMHAEDSQDKAVRYIQLKDGQVISIPEEYILDERTENGVTTLTLEGSDEGFSYYEGNVDKITATYTLPEMNISEFKFTHEDNDQVYKDVAATITKEDGTFRISADVPVLGKRLRPSFTLSEGATLWVDGVQQVSGQTSHRFTSPITYTLVQPKHWKYEVTVKTEEGADNDQWTITPVDLTGALSTNAHSNYGEDIDLLLDGNTATYYHSTWGDGSYQKLTWVDGGTWGDGITEWPYIQISLSEPLDYFRFSYTTSNQTNRFTQGLLISALNKTTGKWDEIVTLDETADGLPQTLETMFVSPVYALGADYTDLRLELTKASHKNYFVISELSLSKCTPANAETPEPEVTGRFVPFGSPCEVSVNYLTDRSTSQYNVPAIYLTFGDGTTWDKSQWIGQTLPDGTNTKENWIDDCTFRLDGAGIWPDIETVEGCQIRGRGNSSWSWTPDSKNPYRVKLPKKQKQSPFNLTKDRQWVFIANKQRGSMTTNAIAQKIAAMVDGEATCYMVPIDLYVNGHYRGSYNFTSKIAISENSVDIDDTKGCLLEMDDYFDENIKFRDEVYDLPVNVKDPDFTEEDPDRTITQEGIVTSFGNLVSTIESGENLSTVLDMEAWSKYWLINDLVCNMETHHPKSCYIFNENPAQREPWKFGPAWDFDWAFGYETTHDYFITEPETDIFSALYEYKPGRLLYDAIRNSEEGKRAYYKEWINFRAEGRLEELMEYIDDYTEFVLPSFEHNNTADVNETDYTDYTAQAEQAKSWLKRRADYIFNSLEKFDMSPDIVDPDDYGQPTCISNASEDGVNRMVDVYSINGVRVRHQVPFLKSLEGLAPGMYVVGGKVRIVAQ